MIVCGHKMKLCEVIVYFRCKRTILLTKKSISLVCCNFCKRLSLVFHKIGLAESACENEVTLTHLEMKVCISGVIVDYW